MPSTTPRGHPAFDMSWGQDTDQVLDEPEVGLVVRDEWNAGDVRGRCDREIHGAPAGLRAALRDRSREPAPFARDGRVDRERVERGLDDAEALGAASALVRIAGDQDAEVKLGQGGGADRALERPG